MVNGKFDFFASRFYLYVINSFCFSTKRAIFAILTK